MTALEEACDAVHDALPAGWRVNRPEYLEDLNRWHVVAADYRAGRKHPDYVIAQGMTETRALQGLAGLLRVWRVRPVDGSAVEGRYSNGAG